ncbi:Protein of unknown function [Pyronema omphalodes CBS 100304]|uniref:Uncharacterized protein n=1 Tax=Pyronema omphalodes (strain CBS 100304) TaxID=1076935 RepID=U4LHB2_PYROM|nr:Protein of unknown function [Pyronema omphalodes CBS 100304]
MFFPQLSVRGFIPQILPRI